MTRIPAILSALVLGASASAQIVTQPPGQNGSGFSSVYQAYPNVPLTGSVTETNLAAVRIPANSITANGVVRVTLLLSMTNNANTKTITVRFNPTSGAVSGGQIGTAGITSSASMQTLIIIRNTGATNSQAYYTTGGVGTAPYGTTGVATGTAAVDTTQDSYININGTLAVGTDTLTLLGYTVFVTHP